MKKLILASVIAAATTFGANASILDFDGTSFGGGVTTFDQVDFNSDVASVSQTDTSGDGTILGVDSFAEFGTTEMVNFLLSGSSNVLPTAYEMHLDYSLSGTAEQKLVPFSFLDVLFSGGTADLIVDTTVDQILNGAQTTVASMTLTGGSCLVLNATNSGFCDVDFSFTPTAAGYFSSNGTDLLSLGGPITSTLIVTVQEIIGLSFNYNGLGAGATQDFQIRHDGNLIINVVPEPTSVAILGLGLLGLAGVRSRKA